MAPPITAVQRPCARALTAASISSGERKTGTTLVAPGGAAGQADCGLGRIVGQVDCHVHIVIEP